MLGNPDDGTVTPTEPLEVMIHDVELMTNFYGLLTSAGADALPAGLESVQMANPFTANDSKKFKALLVQLNQKVSDKRVDEAKYGLMQRELIKNEDYSLGEVQEHD
jgi:hypothetical protein